jgi:hypothetical protein
MCNGQYQKFINFKIQFINPPYHSPIVPSHPSIDPSYQPSMISSPPSIYPHYQDSFNTIHFIDHQQASISHPSPNLDKGNQPFTNPFQASTSYSSPSSTNPFQSIPSQYTFSDENIFGKSLQSHITLPTPWDTC